MGGKTPEHLCGNQQPLMIRECFVGLNRRTTEIKDLQPLRRDHRKNARQNAFQDFLDFLLSSQQLTVFSPAAVEFISQS